MTVYVDTMRSPVGRMIMCHMIADTEDELHAMADRIGVARRWYQGDHYDISLGRKGLAIKYGAVLIMTRTCACMVANRRRTGSLGHPSTAEAVWKTYRQNRDKGKKNEAIIMRRHDRFIYDNE